MKGKDINDLFFETVKKKYDFLGFTDKEMTFFLRGLLIGAEGMKAIIREKIPTGSPTSFNTQNQIATLFREGKTLNSKYFQEKWMI